MDGVIKPEVKDLRACPEVGGTVMFPADSNPYPFGVDPYWHGTKVSELRWLEETGKSTMANTIAADLKQQCASLTVLQTA